MMRWPWQKSLAAQSAPATAPRPALRIEVAPSKRDTYETGAEYLDILPNPDVTLARAQAKHGEYRYPYGVYEEIRTRDLHLQSVLAQRIGAVLAAPRAIQPGNETPAGMACAELARAAVHALEGWETDLRQMQGAIYLGLSVHEVLWTLDSLELPGGGSRETVRPLKLMQRHPRRFLFNADSELRLLTPDAMIDGVEVPERTFIVHTPLGEYENPYGTGLASSTYFHSLFKRDALFWWQLFNEKYASPTVKLTHPAQATDSEKENYRKIIRSIQQQTGLLIPEGVAVDLFEAQRVGTVSSYKTFLEYLDAAESKLVLGQTLTTQQSDTGSYSLGKVHLLVRGDIIAQDAQALCQTVNALLRWIVDLNFAPGQRVYPTYQIDVDAPEDAAANLNKFDMALNKLRLPLSKAQVYAESNLIRPELPAGTAEDDVLMPPAPAPNPFAAPSGFTQGAGQAILAGRDAHPVMSADFAARARVYGLAASEGQLPSRTLADLMQRGVSACAKFMADLPDFTRDWIIEQAGKLSLKAGEPVGDPAKLPWDEWALPEEMRISLRDRLNDDLIVGYLVGRESAIKSAGKAAAAGHMAILGAADENAPRVNPLIEPLFGTRRMIPREVLSVFTRMVHEGLTWEEFYRLDALGRHASFTAWDLCEADVRHIGGAMQDAMHWGWTVQQFADYLYDRLEARYVEQGTALHAWHVETIYHTNLAKAYNTAQMDEVWADKELFPYIEFINPDPQFPTCVEMAGKVWPVDDPTWRSYIPPLHFNCGSSIATVTVGMLERSGVKPQTAPPVNQPEWYSGPGGKGVAAPFGAWAPSDERYKNLEEQIR